MPFEKYLYLSGNTYLEIWGATDLFWANLLLEEPFIHHLKKKKKEEAVFFTLSAIVLSMFFISLEKGKMPEGQG